MGWERWPCTSLQRSLLSNSCPPCWFHECCGESVYRTCSRAPRWRILATGAPAIRVPRVLKPLAASAEGVGRTTGSAASIPAVVALAAVVIAAVAAASYMVLPCVVKTLVSTAKCRSYRCGGAWHPLTMNLQKGVGVSFSLSRIELWSCHRRNSLI